MIYDYRYRQKWPYSSRTRYSGRWSTRALLWSTVLRITLTYTSIYLPEHRYYCTSTDTQRMMYFIHSVRTPNHYRRNILQGSKFNKINACNTTATHTMMKYTAASAIRWESRNKEQMNLSKEQIQRVCHFNCARNEVAAQLATRGLMYWCR